MLGKTLAVIGVVVVAVMALSLVLDAIKSTGQGETIPISNTINGKVGKTRFQTPAGEAEGEVTFDAVYGMTYVKITINNETLIQMSESTDNTSWTHRSKGIEIVREDDIFTFALIKERE